MVVCRGPFDDSVTCGDAAGIVVLSNEDCNFGLGHRMYRFEANDVCGRISTFFPVIPAPSHAKQNSNIERDPHEKIRIE